MTCLWRCLSIRMDDSSLRACRGEPGVAFVEHGDQHEIAFVAEVDDCLLVFLPLREPVQISHVSVDVGIHLPTYLSVR
jgi:hypothetical protein